MLKSHCQTDFVKCVYMMYTYDLPATMLGVSGQGFNKQYELSMMIGGDGYHLPAKTTNKYPLQSG